MIFEQKDNNQFPSYHPSAFQEVRFVAPELVRVPFAQRHMEDVREIFGNIPFTTPGTPPEMAIFLGKAPYPIHIGDSLNAIVTLKPGFLVEHIDGTGSKDELVLHINMIDGKSESCLHIPPNLIELENTSNGHIIQSVAVKMGTGIYFRNVPLNSDLRFKTNPIAL